MQHTLQAGVSANLFSDYVEINVELWNVSLCDWADLRLYWSFRAAIPMQKFE